MDPKCIECKYLRMLDKSEIDQYGGKFIGMCCKEDNAFGAGLWEEDIFLGYYCSDFSMDKPSYIREWETKLDQEV